MVRLSSSSPAKRLYQLMTTLATSSSPGVARMQTATNNSPNILDFINASPTPFHAVANAIDRLTKAGFTRLSETDNWAVGQGHVALGSKYFVTRNSSLIAFTIPSKIDQDKALGMSIVGTHTDSPRFIVKPVSKREKLGYIQVGVETCESSDDYSALNHSLM